MRGAEGAGVPRVAEGDALKASPGSDSRGYRTAPPDAPRNGGVAAVVRRGRGCEARDGWGNWGHAGARFAERPAPSPRPPEPAPAHFRALRASRSRRAPQPSSSDSRARCPPQPDASDELTFLATAVAWRDGCPGGDASARAQHAREEAPRRFAAGVPRGASHPSSRCRRSTKHPSRPRSGS